MSAYSISVFLHIVGALTLFAALGLEWAGLFNLRRAATAAQVREWARLLSVQRFLNGPAALVVLATGIYMSATRWGHQGWIGLGLLGLVLMAVLGAVFTGRRAAAIRATMPAGDGPLPLAFRRLLNDPMLLLSAWLRTSLALGVVFLMSVKPRSGVALTAMGVALAAGLLAALPALTSERRPSPSGADSSGA